MEGEKGGLVVQTRGVNQPIPVLLIPSPPDDPDSHAPQDVEDVPAPPRAAVGSGDSSSLCSVR